MRAIKILKPGIKLGDIGYEIQSFVEDKGFSVVRDFCGLWYKYNISRAT